MDLDGTKIYSLERSTRPQYFPELTGVDYKDDLNLPELSGMHIKFYRNDVHCVWVSRSSAIYIS